MLILTYQAKLPLRGQSRIFFHRVQAGRWAARTSPLTLTWLTRSVDPRDSGVPRLSGSPPRATATVPPCDSAELPGTGARALASLRVCVRQAQFSDVEHGQNFRY